jgi:hypothetical protein
LLETPDALQPRELREALNCLSAEAGKIRGDADEKKIEEICGEVRRACTDASDIDSRALDRQKIVDATAALVDFVERT